MEILEKPIGILGGTFDPIHNGHLHIANCVLQKTPVQDVKFIPCYQPVHRETPHASANDRLLMIKTAISNFPAFSVDPREIFRETPSFMIETLSSLRADFPFNPLCLILGADAYLKIPSWKNWQTLLDYAHFIVINRPLHNRMHPNVWLKTKEENDVDFMSQYLNGGIIFLDIPPNPISATLIRQKIHDHEAISSLVPSGVESYIKQHALYL